MAPSSENYGGVETWRLVSPTQLFSISHQLPFIIAGGSPVLNVHLITLFTLCNIKYATHRVYGDGNISVRVV